MPGLSLLHADFTDHGFAPHYHDALVVAVTETGGSVFRSRGEVQDAHSAALLIFNPAEGHSGTMGWSTRWRYRSLYLEQSAIDAVNRLLGTDRMPYFTANAVRDRDPIAAFAALHRLLEGPADPVYRSQKPPWLPASTTRAPSPAISRRPTPSHRGSSCRPPTDGRAHSRKISQYGTVRATHPASLRVHPCHLPGSATACDMMTTAIEHGWIPGIVGEAVTAHAAYDARTWGFGPTFEAGVAVELGQFVRRYDPSRDRLFRAMRTGRLVGTLTIDGSDPTLEAGDAHLRWFIVMAADRSAGVGRSLMTAAMGVLEAAGYRSCHLTTFAGLVAARRLYLGHGFRLVDAAPGERWGTAVTEQRFEWRR